MMELNLKIANSCLTPLNMGKENLFLFFFEKLIRLLLGSSFVLIISCNGQKDRNSEQNTEDVPSSLHLDSIIVFPHDSSSFTQGLIYHNGKLFEGTGDYENSSVNIVNYSSGKIIDKQIMGTKQLFGEGITIFKNEIFQLTWRNNLVFVYDVDNINALKRTLPWPKEGWGITNNNEDLIISDGSSMLYFVEPTSLAIKKTIQVMLNKNLPADRLNELEYVNGSIYANVFESNTILKIRPIDGKVIGILDCSQLILSNNLSFPNDREKVLNGIAWDSSSNRFFITGKHWPVLFEGIIN